MKLEFVPIDYSSFDWEGRNYVKLTGRTDKGKRICVIDSYEPNFWVIFNEGISEKRISEISKKIAGLEVENAGRKSHVLRVELHDKKYLGKEVKALRVFISNHKDAHSFADQIDFKEVFKRREYDISMISKYIIEKILIQ